MHDTGPGISPEEQERVFDRFYRGSLAESGHIPGTGLGLSIAQEIMQAHGGRVTVESPLILRQNPWSSGPGTEGSGQALLRAGLPGEGSTFTLWLRPEPLA